MKCKLVCACVLLSLTAAATPAQTKHSFSGKCAKPDVTQSVPVPDKDGHVFTIEQGKCETSAGEVGGAKSKDGVYSAHADATATHLRNWGVYAETYDGGDKIFYAYQSTATIKDGAVVTGGNKYQITGGTGKMKGIKGSGACKLTGSAGGGLDYTCTGEYTIGAAAPEKEKK